MICQAVRQNCWSPGAVPPRSSSRALAESPAVSGVSVGSRTFGARPLAVGTAAGGKEHEGCAAGESYLYPGKPALPPRKISLISGYGSP